VTGNAAPRVICKPEAAIFVAALNAAHAYPQDAVMLGDNPLTDIAGARRLGIPTIQISPPGQIVGETIESLMQAWEAP